MHTGKELKKIEIVSFKEMKVNLPCKRNAKTCLALKSKKQKLEKEKKLAGHPASKTCLLHGGAPVILKDKKRNEYDFCRFKDNSLIDSWSLLDKETK